MVARSSGTPHKVSIPDSSRLAALVRWRPSSQSENLAPPES